MGKYDFKLDMYDDNTISWIAKIVRKNSTVLEFGPANGRLTRYLKNQKNCIVDIVEIDEESGKEAAQYARKALIGEEKGNIENFFWLENGKQYDYVVFADVLEHLIHADEVLKRCQLILKEKGNILVSVPNIAHNSIIIELINDEFRYNPTGILDNTHVRFFTRNSFERMASEAGWAVINEKAKRIRVGETEIKNKFSDVPLEVAKELVHRPLGDVYQYLFVLASSEEYVSGKWQRTVSLDSNSHYYFELFFERNAEYNYKESVQKYFDPYNGKINVESEINIETSGIKILPINCNCVLENVSVKIGDGISEREVKIEKSNGKQIENRFYFIDEKPEFFIHLKESDKKIKFEANILKYDFKDKVFEKLFSVIEYEQGHVKEVCDKYEQEIERREEEYKNNIKKISADYENKISIQKGKNQEETQQLTQQFDVRVKQIVNDYEKEISRREKERVELEKRLENYERAEEEKGI